MAIPMLKQAWHKHATQNYAAKLAAASLAVLVLAGCDGGTITYTPATSTPIIETSSVPAASSISITASSLSSVATAITSSQHSQEAGELKNTIYPGWPFDVVELEIDSLHSRAIITSSQQSHYIYAVDLETGEYSQHFACGRAVPRKVAISPNGLELYVVCTWRYEDEEPPVINEGSIEVYDLATFTQTKRHSLTFDPYDIVVSNYDFIVSSALDEGGLFVYDKQSGNLQSSIASDTRALLDLKDSSAVLATSANRFHMFGLRGSYIYEWGLDKYNEDIQKRAWFVNKGDKLILAYNSFNPYNFEDIGVPARDNRTQIIDVTAIPNTSKYITIEDYHSNTQGDVYYSDLKDYTAQPLGITATRVMATPKGIYAYHYDESLGGHILYQMKSPANSPILSAVNNTPSSSSSVATSAQYSSDHYQSSHASYSANSTVYSSDSSVVHSSSSTANQPNYSSFAAIIKATPAQWDKDIGHSLTDNDNNRMIITGDGYDNTVSTIDLFTGKVINNMAYGKFALGRMALSEDNQTLYILGGFHSNNDFFDKANSGYLIIADAHTLQEKDIIPLDFKPYSIALSNDNIFIAGRNKNSKIHTFDMTGKNLVASTITMPNAQLIFDAASQRLYASNRHNKITAYDVLGSNISIGAEIDGGEFLPQFGHDLWNQTFIDEHAFWLSPNGQYLINRSAEVYNASDQPFQGDTTTILSVFKSKISLKA